jgi:hypothetical protein
MKLGSERRHPHTSRYFGTIFLFLEHRSSQKDRRESSTDGGRLSNTYCTRVQERTSIIPKRGT